MGCGGSTEAASQPQKAVVKSGGASKNLTADEVATLKSRFQLMSRLHKDDGMIDRNEFLQILNYSQSLFTDRIFDLFDTDNSSTISVDEFIECMAILGPKGTREDKIRLSFRMWDINGDSVIAKSELERLMRSSLEQSSILISQGQIEKLIDSTFSLADLDKSGAITLPEYEKLVQKFPSMISHMTIDVMQAK